VEHCDCRWTVRTGALVMLVWLGVSGSVGAQQDSYIVLQQIVAQRINEERRVEGVDTLEFQLDTFCFAEEWADSTVISMGDWETFWKYTHKGQKTRDFMHRRFWERIGTWEHAQGYMFKTIGECIAYGSTEMYLYGANEKKDVLRATRLLLNSRDKDGLIGHRTVLLDKEFDKISVGISFRESAFCIVVYTYK